MSDPFENDEEKRKYMEDYKEGERIAEADLNGTGPNNSIAGVFGIVRGLIDPSEGRDAGYEERIKKGRTEDDEDDEE